MVLTRTKKPLTYEDLKVRHWIKTNWGILTKVAVSCHCSEQLVQQVAYGRSNLQPGHEVENALRNAGWPGTRRKK